MLNLLELVRLHKPMIIAIIEPCIYCWTVDDVCKKMGKSDWFWVKASGFSGDIWILWYKLDLKLIVIHAWQQLVHLSVLSSAGTEWELTVIYANPNP